jgi:hypothetical protein
LSDHTPRHSRQDLVLDIAHRDGGPHVDDRDADDAHRTRDHFSYEAATGVGKRISPFQPVQGNRVSACPRQLANAVLLTLAVDLPGVLATRAGKVAVAAPPLAGRQSRSVAAHLPLTRTSRRQISALSAWR